MRTSLNELAAIEQQLLQAKQPDEQLLFEAKMILNSELRENVTAQQQAYALIKQYGRKCLKAELENVYQQLLHQPQHQTFMQRIKQIFKRT